MLRKRGELDINKDLVEFVNKLEKVLLKIIEDGVMIGDLVVFV